ncbi:uncharacterized protein B0H64DRAFT_180806 [Chaetomium fimeti]|uniref:NmrA-like domain-containing protein n=1 Tax=Chaetomium fimeti TaxID=1854472 RepID=A0AAE0HD86_9PEZI|nr:hypothetical protein B0H64DRAFT_180806 [Chaetomium fimeti]
MSSTILVAGATGNTGQGVVTTLSKLLESSNSFSKHKIIALTRSSRSTAAQKLAALPRVDIIEYPWAEITADWFRHHNVVRAFIASHIETSHFAEESTFLLEALKAGLEYVVRISTTATNVRPDCNAYYARAHWAIEAMLSSPAFTGLRWTSLQPNVFSPVFLQPAVALVDEFRRTGKVGALRLTASEDAPVALIDPIEIGIFAAHLLVEEDVIRHDKAKYVLNGPEDISGRQIVDLVEQEIGVKIENVVFKDVSWVDYVVAQSSAPKSIVSSLKFAPVTTWEGKCTASTTSQEVLRLAAPKVTPTDYFKTMLQK